MPSWNQPPAMEIDPQNTYSATLETDKGTMTIELLPKVAPMTVNNFVFLARQGFYDGVPFHRVINNFMIQTGDPTGTGRGGPGYRFADEPVTMPYRKGIVAMANAGPNTNGSQFFIVHGENVALPPNYTIFGRLLDGEETLDAIATAPVRRGGEGSEPVNVVRITAVTISEK